MSDKKLSPLRLKDRQAGRLEERKVVVAWLRTFFVGTDYADAIEAGDHLK